MTGSQGRELLLWRSTLWLFDFDKELEDDVLYWVLDVAGLVVVTGGLGLLADGDRLEDE